MPDRDFSSKVTPPISLSAQERERVVDRLRSALAREPDISFAYLHGSFEEGRAFRDIDVGVYFTDLTETPSSAAMDRALELAGTLSRQLGVPVDVRPLNAAPPTFAFHVLRGRRLLSHDDELLAELMAETGRRYLDIEPILRRATKDTYGSG